MPTKYYKVHGGRLSFAEYWRMSPDPISFTIAAGMKLFGGLPFNFSIPRIDELHEVEWDDLPPPARRALKEPAEQFESAGLELVLCHRLPLLESHRIGIGAVFLAADGLSFATANFGKEHDVVKVELACVTRFDDDSFGVTTTAKKQLKPRPDYVIDRHPGATGDELHEKHVANIERWESKGKQPQRLTPKTLPDVLLEGEQGTVDFHAERGVFIPMSKAEVRQIREQDEGTEDE